MLETLARHGFSIEAFSGTVLELGQGVDLEPWLSSQNIGYEHDQGGCSISVDARGVRDDAPAHFRLAFRGVPVTLHRSPNPRPHKVDGRERDDFLRLFEGILDRFRPDVLVNYGGDLLAHQVRSRARERGIAVVFALHNLSYTGIGPFTTADAVVVPSRFSADHYRETIGLDCTVLPYLVDFDRARYASRDPRYVTFVTPSHEKGVYAFARIADELGKLRPDIPLLVVEGRGTERTLVDCGIDLRAHGNVSLMGNTPDPRHFWSVTKVCLMPSVWSESQGLVAVEAMLNGIPVVGSDRGAIPETLGDSGVVLPLPAWLTPSSRDLPTADEVAPWIEAVIRLWDDPNGYAQQSRLAVVEARRWAPDVLEPRYVRFFEEIIRG